MAGDDYIFSHLFLIEPFFKIYKAIVFYGTALDSCIETEKVYEISKMTYIPFTI